jgi:DNA-binding XRE family transcriptional regulator
VTRGEWQVYVAKEVRDWLDDLDTTAHTRVVQAIDALAEAGPGLGRPLVDTIHGSSISNLKELRPGTMRILFAFDPWRSSILLVAGDKVRQMERLVPGSHPTGRTTLRALSEGAHPGGGTAMNSHVAWSDIRDEHVERAGGEAAVEAGKQQLLAEVIGHRLAEVRRARGMTQQQVADRMGVTKGRVSQIERGKVSGHDVIARFASALGGRLHQAVYFDDGDITAIA